MSDETESADAGGSGGGKMLLILGLVGGLAIGGGGAFFLLGGQQPAPETAEDESEKEPEIIAPDQLFSVLMERVAVPIYRDRNGRPRFEGNYFIDIEIQSRTESDQIKVRQSEARLKHAFIDAISKQGLMQKDRPLELDLEKVRAVFLDRAAKILGPDLVYDLSVTNVQRMG